MRLIKYILTFFPLLSGHLIFACSCFTDGDFLTVAPKSEFVALVKVTKYLSFKAIYEKQTPMSMEVEVVEVYKGTETRKKLIVWGDNGVLCRPYLSQFDIGKHYVIAFYKASDGSKGYVHEDERPTDYAISICGEFWLNADIVAQKAFGSVTDKQKEISFSDLRKKLSSQPVSIVQSIDTSLNGTYVGLEYIGTTTDPAYPKKLFKMFHLGYLKIRNDSVFLDQSPIFVHKKDTTYSASDGGFFYYSGTLIKTDTTVIFDLKEIFCDYCGVQVKIEPDGTQQIVKRIKQLKGPLTDKGFLIDGYLYRKIEMKEDLISEHPEPFLKSQ